MRSVYTLGVGEKTRGLLESTTLKCGGMGGICSDKHINISPTAFTLPDLHFPLLSPVHGLGRTSMTRYLQVVLGVKSYRKVDALTFL